MEKREIKFRAWDKFTKRMWKWDEHNAFTTNEGSIRQWFTDHDLIQMEYTGIKDNLGHGSEIYEGDLIKRFCSCGNCNAYWEGEIVFSHAMFCFRDYENEQDNPLLMYDEDGAQIRIVVIGNIYEDVALCERIRSGKRELLLKNRNKNDKGKKTTSDL